MVIEFFPIAYFPLFTQCKGYTVQLDDSVGAMGGCYCLVKGPLVTVEAHRHLCSLEKEPYMYMCTRDGNILQDLVSLFSK